MIRKLFLRSLFFSCFFTLAAAETPSPKIAKTAGSEWVLSSNQFGFDVFKSLLNDPEKNVCVSPFGVFSALTLIYAGAGENTQKEMEAVLHMVSPPLQFAKEYQDLSEFLSIPYSGQRDMRILNTISLWMASKYPFSPPFQQTLMRDFKAVGRRADFSRLLETARYDINSLMKERTDGKVDEMIPYDGLLDTDRLVVANAFVIKAKWSREIMVTPVQPLPFFSSQEKTLALPMLAFKGALMTFEDPAATVVQIPYVVAKANGPSVHFLLIVPKDASGLEDLQKNISVDQLNKWTGQLSLKKTELVLPKFQINQLIVLDDTLKKLGLNRVFSEQADLSGISIEKGLMLSQVFHRPVFSLSALGTEEPLSLMAPLPRSEISNEYQIISVDRPFLFIVYEKTTGAILLLGRMGNFTGGIKDGK